MDPGLPRPPRPRSVGERVHEWVVWFGTGRLAATALAVIAVAVGGMWLLQGSPSRAEDQLPFASHASTTAAVVDSAVTTTTTVAASTVVVYVAGAVASAGVYTLAAPARVTDALTAAGGPSADANLDVVNLAAPVRDGERIYVPAVGDTIPAVVGEDPVSTQSLPAAPVNVNTATEDQLDVLPGVGPTTAAAIVAHREQHGPFQSVDALGDVRGIGPAKLDALRGLVTV